MEKKYYVLYLRPSRPDFAQTMTDEERGVMQQHIAYWQPYLNDGTLLVFGPVMHPESVYGIAIVATDSEEKLQTLINGDPAGKINRYEYFPVRAVVSPKFSF